ncbi:uncharacterized protein LOC143028920 [Oratosquilla oratoria]|uniref:uncharacterized protein LOC143028920 n=1 Tax=Oratosquilla oratoria TaxID=337810 RepID=UPI003F776FF5
MKPFVTWGLVAMWIAGLGIEVEMAAAAAVGDGRGRSLKQSSCYPLDTCSGSPPRRVPSGMNRSCSCDSACALYGDCCRDAEAYDAEEQVRIKEHFKCVTHRLFGDLYMRGLCAPDWNDNGDAEIAYLCALGDPSASSMRTDPVLDIPVTSLATSLTYTNSYCALCNREDPVQLVHWVPRLECPTLANYARRGDLTQDFARTNLTYNKARASWGFELGIEGAPPVFHPCNVDPIMPEVVASLQRTCVDSVSSCATDYPDGDVAELCGAYTAVVYHFNTPYRNVHCAKCNHIDPTLIFCYPTAVGRRGSDESLFNPLPFIALFDFEDLSDGNLVGSSCEAHQMWDPFSKRCRNICMSSHLKYRNGRCVSEARVPGSLMESSVSPKVLLSPTTPTNNDTAEALFSSATSTNLFESSRITMMNDCPRLYLLEDELEKEKNGSIFVPKYQKTFEKDQYETDPNGGGGIIVCAPEQLLLQQRGKFPFVMAWVTLICLGASCLCLALHLIAFIFIPSPKNLSEKNLASLCFALLAAYVTFFAGQWTVPGGTGCFAVGAIMYFFFLASFCWMSVLAFDTRRMLRTTTRDLRVSKGRQWRKFVAYSLYGWLLPGAAFLALVIIDLERPDGVHWAYLPMMGEFRCWFGQRKALLVFFAAPLGVILSANLFFFVSSVRIVQANRRSRMQAISPTLVPVPSERQRLTQFRLHVRLALLMGLTWVTGIGAGYLNLEPIWYIFVVLNTLQGLFIFLAFTRKSRAFPEGLRGFAKKIFNHGFRFRIS